MSIATLRDFLLAALAQLPGTRSFHIHVLVSAPHKHHGLFPYAHPRPKVYLQDVLVLLSEQADSGDAEPRALVTAVELSVYNVPSTSCGIVYVSKVDTTGQGAHPSPTATLVKALLTYYADPKTRPLHVDTLWIQLFARAQGQYLFPNSSEYEGKKPLPDVKLCAWWKRVFSEVAGELAARTSVGAGDGDKAKLKMGLYYVLPGFNELEALTNLHMPSASAHTASNAAPSWVYGHQYSQTDIRLPCSPPRSGNNLGHYIPWFDDDPKSRFMDEIAHTTEGDMVKSPEKRSRTASGTFGRTRSRSDLSVDENGHAGKDNDEKDKEEKHHTPEGELGKVTPDEFWERMSFRQECIAGAVTGFFALGIASPLPSPTSSLSTPPPLKARAGEVAPRLVKRVITSLMQGWDFSTRENAVRATETLEGVIRGLCENVVAQSPPASTSAPPDPRKIAPLLFAHEDLDEHGAAKGDTETIDHSRAKTPEPRATLEVPRTPTPKRSKHALPDSSPNPFPEPVASPETYTAHIFGSIAIDNPALPSKSASDGTSEANGTNGTAPQAVTVLAVRKKKRKADA